MHWGVTVGAANSEEETKDGTTRRGLNFAGGAENQGFVSSTNREGYCKTSRVMAESQSEAISLALNSTKLNATNSLFREDPSLVFSIVTEARDQTLPGSLLARPRR